MCGITGYVGDRSAVETVLDNLKRLEYRGYDSAGVAYPNCTRVEVVRATGKIANLERALGSTNYDAHVAIAHTRWATHGSPTENNAHPHTDCSGRIAVVHNGIVENYAILRSELIGAGHEFTSETDTEVLAHLIESEIELLSDRNAESVGAAIRAALRRVRGSYALAIISRDAPDIVFAARKDSPLVIGLGADENFLASDIPAVMKYSRRVILMEDGDFAAISRSGVGVVDCTGMPAMREPIQVTWDDTAAEKSGYEHFMLKEIHEGPKTVRDTLRGRLMEDGTVDLPGLPFSIEDWTRMSRIAIVGCGTAYNAGEVGKRLIEQIVRRPVTTTVASEFRYSDPLVGDDTLVVLISQSGETADTLAAMREARAKGASTLAIVNVVGSTLAREADAVLLTQAGPEIGVASTKAYLAQLTALMLLTLFLARQAQARGEEIDCERERELRSAIALVPAAVEDCLKQEATVATLAKSLAGHSCFFYLGRGYDYSAALEAALKLKEISYLHAEAYPAGEMKHGPLALVERGVAVVGLCTQSSTHEKMISNLKEVKAREGTVIVILRKGDVIPDCADFVIEAPDMPDALMPVVAMVPMQLLAYYMARARNCDIDQPRNLAKSVTVE